MKQKNKESKFSAPYLLVLLSFAVVIVLGAVLLTFPFSHADGKWGNFLDSLFIPL